MKLIWQFRYVPEGQLEPDELNRWALDAHIKVRPEKMKGYEEFPIDAFFLRVATIVQKGTRNGSVPSVADRFCCTMPVFFGLDFSNNHNIFSNDLEDLKKQVEEKLKQIKYIFNSAEG